MNGKKSLSLSLFLLSSLFSSLSTVRLGNQVKCIKCWESINFSSSNHRLSSIDRLIPLLTFFFLFFLSLSLSSFFYFFSMKEVAQSLPYFFPTNDSHSAWKTREREKRGRRWRGRRKKSWGLIKESFWEWIFLVKKEEGEKERRKKKDEKSQEKRKSNSSNPVSIPLPSFFFSSIFFLFLFFSLFLCLFLSISLSFSPNFLILSCFQS